jgi:hypothetical protein
MFVIVVLTGLWLWYQSDDNVKPLKVHDEDNRGGAATRGAAAGKSDAFKIKEERKQAMLERARARYKELHPEFVFPKDKAV